MSDRFGRFLKAAKSVKGRLESSGLLDKLGDATSTKAPREAAPAARLPGRSEEFSERVARGVPNPFDLISRDEVARAAGADLGEPSEMFTEETIGCEFRQPSDRGPAWFQVNIYHAPRGEPFKPDAVWRGAIAEAADGTEVDGIGDLAFRWRDVLFVRKGDHVFYVAGGGPEGSDAKDAVESIARIVIGRL